MRCNNEREENKINYFYNKEEINEMLRISFESFEKRSLNIRQDLDVMREEFMKNMNKSKLIR